MSIKYKGKFTDRQGTDTWEVAIHDGTYTSYQDGVLADGGSVEGLGCFPTALNELVEYTQITLGAEGFELEYGKRGDDPHKAIKGSSITFNWHLADSSQEAFIESVAQTQEQNYYVRLFRNSVIYWQGPILQDLIRVPYAKPQIVNIKATDGLARLKGLKGDIANYDTILEGIIDVLRDIDSANLWADSDNFVRTSVRWFEDQMWTGAPINGLDALAYSKLYKQSVLFNYDKDGNEEYRTWYDWLQCVLETFGARIFLAEGVYVIEQIDEVANTPSRYNMYQRNYSVSNNPTTATGIALSGEAFPTFLPLTATATTNRVGTESSYGYLPANKSINVYFDAPFERNNLIDVNRISDTTDTSFGDVEFISGASNALQILLRNQFYKVTNSSGTSKVFILRQKLKVTVDGSTNYYLAPGSGNTYTWTTTNSSFEYYTTGPLFVQGSASLVIDGENELQGSPIITEDIPIDGTLKVQITMEVLDSTFNTHSNVILVNITSGDGVYVNARKGALVYAYYFSTEGLKPIDGVEYSVDNPTLLQASDVKEYNNVFIGDELSQNDYQRIRVWNVSTNTWNNSESWKYRGTGTAYTIIKLRLNQAMNYFVQPRRLFDLNYQGSINPVRALRLGSKDYFWNWLKVTARYSEVETEAFEIATPSTAYTVDDNLINQERTPQLQGIDYGKIAPADGIFGINSGYTATETVGTITSIDVTDLQSDLGYTGDSVRLYNPLNGSYFDVVLTANALQGHTSISIASTTVNTPIAAGTRLIAQVSENSKRSAAKETYSLTAIPDSELILENSGLITTSGFLTTWKDASGNANNFTGVDLEPNFDGAFQVYFDGSTGRASNVTISQSSGYTLVLLIKLIEATTGKYVVYGNSGNVYISTGTGDDVTLGTSVKSVTAEIPRDEWVVFQARMDGASSEWRTNYGAWNAANLDADTLETPHFGYDGSTNYCEMSLAAACIFANVLTDNQADAVTTNLINRV